MGARVSSPLVVNTSPSSIHVYIMTETVLGDLVDYGVSTILLRLMAISAYAAYFPLPSRNYTISSIDLDEYNIVEILPNNK